MFVRIKTVAQDGRSYEYLQIVRSVRDGARVRQELVASLGRRDLLVATGQLDRLVQALGPLQHPPAGGRGGQGRALRRPRRAQLGPGLGIRPAVGAAGRGGDARAPRRRAPVRLRPRAGGLRACSGCALRARTCRAPPGRRRSRRPVSRIWRCTTSTGPCRGWRRSATRSSASSSSRTAICSRASSTWCSSTPPRSTSTATA